MGGSDLLSYFFFRQRLALNGDLLRCDLIWGCTFLEPIFTETPHSADVELTDAIPDVGSQQHSKAAIEDGRDAARCNSTVLQFCLRRKWTCGLDYGSLLSAPHLSNFCRCHPCACKTPKTCRAPNQQQCGSARGCRSAERATRAIRARAAAEAEAQLVSV